jgi:NADPH2:quinone reductase
MADNIGLKSGPVPPVDLLKLGAKNLKLMRPRVFGYLETQEELDSYTRELFDLLPTGKVNSKIHEVYPLKDVARAHSDLEGTKTTGKLLLKV